MLWHPPVPAESSSRRSGCIHATVVLQFGQRTWMELPPATQVQRRCKQWCSPVPLVLDCSLSNQRTLTVHHLLSLSLMHLLCRSCLTGSQMSLRRNCSKYRCSFNVFLRGGNLSIHLAHPGPASWNLFYHPHPRTPGSLISPSGNPLFQYLYDHTG